jgi:Oxidoreductase family, NAD-binding Rossmann fold
LRKYSIVRGTEFLTAESMMCVAGCGHWGKNLARNFSVLNYLYAVCESDPDRLQSFAEQYPEARPYSSLEDALGDPQVDAVALATPAEEHYRMALAALRAGKTQEKCVYGGVQVLNPFLHSPSEFRSDWEPRLTAFGSRWQKHRGETGYAAAAAE